MEKLPLSRSLLVAGLVCAAAIWSNVPFPMAAETGKQGKISSTTTDADAPNADAADAKKDDADAQKADDAKPTKKGQKKATGKKSAGGKGAALKSSGAGTKTGFAGTGGGGGGPVAGNTAGVPFIPGGLPLNAGYAATGGNTAVTSGGAATAGSANGTTNSSATSGTQDGTFQLSQNVSDLLELTNAERKKQNLPELTLNPTLMQMAREHSANMARLDTMSHTLEGVTFAQRLQQSGYQALTAGENIAAGQRSAAEAVEDWMNSPGHRANILNEQFTEIGVAIATSKSGVPYYTQEFGKPEN